jgi:glucose/arabinose dehydrogenase
LFYLNYNPQDGPRRTRIAEWKVDSSSLPTSAQEQRVLLEVGQPYSNHDGGGLAFGDDHMLYVALGDGGSQNDPHKNGQNPQSLLGKMLRLDPKPSADLPYSIPNDNPFLKQPKFRPEIWAYGLRNPWRFSFTGEGRIITGDVGQDRFEEVDLIRGGDNLGWNVREAGHCLSSDDSCSSNGFVDPIFEYDRSLGSCVTGGTIYRGTEVPSLKDKYIFGDCASGRLWALPVPKESGGSYQVAELLGRWSQLSFVTFARDAQGEVYVADFTGGTIYKIQPAAQTAR